MVHVFLPRYRPKLCLNNVNRVILLANLARFDPFILSLSSIPLPVHRIRPVTSCFSNYTRLALSILFAALCFTDAEHR